MNNQAVNEMHVAYEKKQIEDECDKVDAEQERIRYQKENDERLAAKKASNKHFANVWTQQKNGHHADEAMNNYI